MSLTPPSGPADNHQQPPQQPSARAWTFQPDAREIFDLHTLATSTLALGYGTFTTFALHRDGIPALNRHINRLHHDAHQLGLPEVNRPAITAIAETIHADLTKADPDANGSAQEFCPQRVRLTWTQNRLGHGLLLAVIQNLTPYPTTATVHSSPHTWTRPRVHHGVKSASYADHFLALRSAHQHGSDESIWLAEDQQVTEGATSNVFAHIGDTLITPPGSLGILPGIARQIILDYSHEWRITVTEANFDLKELANCRGAALTSALRGVQEIASLNNAPLPRSPLVAALRCEYDRLIRSCACDI